MRSSYVYMVYFQVIHVFVRSPVSLLRYLLALVFVFLHLQILLPVELMQLTRVLLGCIEPCRKALIDAFVDRNGKRSQICVDGQVVAHRIALEEAAPPADVIAARCLRKADFRAA